MELRFDGEIVHWRGPAPHHFVAVPPALCPAVADAAAELSYGWGVVPVTVCIGATDFTTSLFPKDGGYLVPVKARVRAAEQLDVGDPVTVTVTLAE